MDRKKGILAATTLTGLVLLIILAFSWNGANPLNAFAAPEKQQTNQDLGLEASAGQGLSDSAIQQQLQALQDRNAQLESAILVYQAREQEYQRQIVIANLALQQQAQNSQQTFQGGEIGEREDHD